jgi:hypothetical protein
MTDHVQAKACHAVLQFQAKALTQRLRRLVLATLFYRELLREKHAPKKTQTAQKIRPLCRKKEPAIRSHRNRLGSSFISGS